MAASKAATPRDRAVRSIMDAMFTSDQCVPHSEGSVGVFDKHVRLQQFCTPLAEGAETRDRGPSCGEAKCEYVAATVALRLETLKYGPRMQEHDAEHRQGRDARVKMTATFQMSQSCLSQRSPACWVMQSARCWFGYVCRR